MKKMILASASPRRMEIMKQAGFEFEVMVSDVLEETNVSEPEGIVLQLSRKKALAVYDIVKEDSIIIGADTVVACGNKIMGKPKDKDDAKRMLEELKGSCHSVFTGVTIIVREGMGCEVDSFAVETKVWVNDMSKEEINHYVSLEEPMDKAGAYGIQGRFAVYIKGIEGDYYNVVGLPISEIYKRLKII